MHVYFVAHEEVLKPRVVLGGYFSLPAAEERAVWEATHSCFPYSGSYSVWVYKLDEEEEKLLAEANGRITPKLSRNFTGVLGKLCWFTFNRKTGVLERKSHNAKDRGGDTERMG